MVRADMTFKNNSGSTCFYEAYSLCIGNSDEHLEMLNYILEKGINIIDQKEYVNCFHLACYFSYSQCAFKNNYAYAGK